jgi:hypothetical protein
MLDTTALVARSEEQLADPVPPPNIQWSITIPRANHRAARFMVESKWVLMILR